jgi:hypothetical protein
MPAYEMAVTIDVADWTEIELKSVTTRYTPYIPDVVGVNV